MRSKDEVEADKPKMLALSGLQAKTIKITTCQIIGFETYVFNKI